MPGRDQVENGVGRSETADVDDPGQSAVRDEQVAGDQVAVGHRVGGRSWQVPVAFPAAAEFSDVEDPGAAPQAGVHPGIMGPEVTPAIFPIEGAATGADSAHAADEVGEVAGELGGLSWVLFGGCGAG